VQIGLSVLLKKPTIDVSVLLGTKTGISVLLGTKIDISVLLEIKTGISALIHSGRSNMLD
jgi:hypothetical protein